MKQKTLKVIKEVWPKFLIFTVMLLIVVFQKDPIKMMSISSNEESVKKQFETGKFEDTAFE